MDGLNLLQVHATMVPLFRTHISWVGGIMGGFV